jgi:hypothetical protein
MWKGEGEHQIFAFRTPPSAFPPFQTKTPRRKRRGGCVLVATSFPTNG